ncbi:unnamed protein product [Oreochromis niloticus]|nr:unnamed protein product [Mustela putorius furo]
MTSGQMVTCEAALIPLLLGKQGCNITFVLESSENMKAVLGSVKHLLIQTLLNKASHRDSLFNIMSFSSKVTCWSGHMCSCAPDTVYTALSWIHSISCSSGRDLLSALSIALTDPACHAVHLLFTGFPDQPEAVLRALPALAVGRPVNVFYLQDLGNKLDRNTRDYLQSFTQTTRGSCYLIPFDLNGALEKVIPLYVAESQPSLPSFNPAKWCCPPTSVTIPQLHHISSPLLRSSRSNPNLPVTSCILSGQTLSSPEFFPGSRVLARREGDGLYYMGTVIKQIQGCSGIWVVDFDHAESATFEIVSSQRQLVCSLDMVNDSRDRTCRLTPGDAVLSPWEQDLRRYGPGQVVAATEHRDGYGGNGVRSLQVLMWNSCVYVLPESLVLPISASRHARIVRELQAVTHNQCCSWLCAPQLYCTDCCHSACASCCCSSCLVPPSLGASFETSDELDKTDQVKQVDCRDADVRTSDPELPSSSSSSLSHDETRASTSPSVKIRSKQQRPPWRYWRRTGPEPQHRQPGSAGPRRTTQPVSFSIPEPQISASPNHSSLFQSLPGTSGRRANIRDILSTTSFKPRPPVGLQSL